MASNAPAKTAAELGDSIQTVRRSWEQLALYSGVPGTSEKRRRCTGDADSLQARCGGGRLDLASTAAVLAWLHLMAERQAARRVCRTWRRAAEHGPARVAWADALGTAVEAADAFGASLAARFGRHSFLSRGGAASVFRRGTVGSISGASAGPAAGLLPTYGRLRGASEPLLALPDGTGAILLDKASATTSVPDIGLAVFDMASLMMVGALLLSQAPHGQSVQRPLSLISLRTSHGGCSAGTRQACVVALERLVVVFSWRLGGASGEPHLREARVEEVRWGTGGGKEALRAAAFTGPGPSANVAVLLNHKGAPVVEVFARCAAANSAIDSGASSYVLSGVVSLVSSPGLPAVPPAVVANGTLVGNIAIWASVGSKDVDFACVPAFEGQPRFDIVCDDEETTAIEKKSSGARRGGVAAAFARSRQAAKQGKLRVGQGDIGAGVDMEATRWGYLVEDVDKEPGQPDLKPGDLVIEISGQPLHGLDEETMHWRFGRNICDGVGLTILPAEQACIILELEKKHNEDTAAAIPRKPTQSPASAEGPIKKDMRRGTMAFPARLEAWCIANKSPLSSTTANKELGASAGGIEIPQLIVVADNNLFITELEDSLVVVPREILRSVVRAPFKRPAIKLSALDNHCDVLCVGIARAVLLWRVPALVCSTAKDESSQLLSTIAMPPRCTLTGACIGLSLGIEAIFGWSTAELSGAGADTNGGLDVWHFFSSGGRPPPLVVPPASGAAAGWRNAGQGDIVSEALNSIGAVLDALAPSITSACGSSPPPISTAVDLRPWVDNLSDSTAEELYTATESAERTLDNVAREIRRWLRLQQHGHSRAEDARYALQCGEELRRRVVWPLQAAFLAPDEEFQDDQDDEEVTQPPPVTRPSGGGASDVAALRRQRWLQQRQERHNADRIAAAAAASAAEGGGSGIEASDEAAFANARRGRRGAAP